MQLHRNYAKGIRVIADEGIPRGTLVAINGQLAKAAAGAEAQLAAFVLGKFSERPGDKLREAIDGARNHVGKKTYLEHRRGRVVA
jgi:hypothetical protein